MDRTPRRRAAQVVVGEQRGQGVRMGHRCFWDADTDNYAEEAYRNVKRPLSPAHALAREPRLKPA